MKLWILMNFWTIGAWDNQFDLLFRWNMIHIEEFTENEND